MVWQRTLLLTPMLYTSLYCCKIPKLSSIALIMLIFPSKVYCAGIRKDKDKSNENDFFRKFSKTLKDNHVPNELADDITYFIKGSSETIKTTFEAGIPSQVGYGFMMGYASGFCMKKISKIIAFTVGGIFILIQSLSYNGYINVNYNGIKSDIEKALDLNKDGKVDRQDISIGFDKVKRILGYNMPSGGGFSAGLLMGLRG